MQMSKIVTPVFCMKPFTFVFKQISWCIPKGSLQIVNRLLDLRLSLDVDSGFILADVRTNVHFLATVTDHNILNETS